MKSFYYIIISLILLVLSCGNKQEINLQLVPVYPASFNCNIDGNSRISDILFRETNKILVNRLVSIGISESNIQIFNNGGFINLTVKSNENIERIKRLVTSQGKLELWETFSKDGLNKTKQELKSRDLGIQIKDEPTKLFSCRTEDTIGFNKSTLIAKIKEIIPRNIKLLWSSKADSNGLLDLNIIKITNRDGQAPIDERNIEAIKIIKEKDSEIKLSIRFSYWFITPTNKNYIENKQIAVLIDDKLHSFCTITRHDRDFILLLKDYEAKELEIILKSGCLPYRLKTMNDE